MADWTELSDAAVGIGGIPSGTTVTALRDNVVAFAEQAVGSPAYKYGTYDVQIFATSGTWTKPASAVDTDIASIIVIGAGGGGSAGSNDTLGDVVDGSAGGSIALAQFKMSDLSATENVAVGAGGAGGVRVGGGDGTVGGGNGGNSTFTISGVSGGTLTLTGGGGGGGGVSAGSPTAGALTGSDLQTLTFSDYVGAGGGTDEEAQCAEWGGGGGGGNRFSNPVRGGYSARGLCGNGGAGVHAPSGAAVGEDGQTPAGGGGCASYISSGGQGTGGDGGDGLVFVVCFTNLEEVAI